MGQRERGAGKSTGNGRGGRRPRKQSPVPPGHAFPVVGIGASAGGIEALTRLFSELRADSGMAFVVIQHLDPTHESMLTEILGRATAMPVHEVRDGMRLSRDTVFVIPPNANLTLTDGVFKLTEYTRVRGWHMPIDEFFRSLADARGPRALAVVLSGAASDGALGCRAIKAAGGITFAQQESTARFHEMPHAAIAGGWADFVLPPEGIAKELGRVGSHPLPADPGKEPDTRPGTVKRILSLVRSCTGVDFSNYRQTTIRRRIHRRMVLHRRGTLEEYADFLRNNTEEIRALYDDILITVTSFFRDPESFTLLKKEVFPKLLKGRSPETPVRIWVPGCATGEEVYSLAITLFDVIADVHANVPVQIFATDISERAIERAHAGSYPLSIAADVSPETLRKYFVRQESAYQITKSIRDVCIFARQDLGADPPFSNLDLISCRNLLIYMEPHLQKRILPLFHYALKPTGYLLLGSAETIRSSDDIFQPEDRSHRLFSRKAVSAPHVLDFGTMPRTRRDAPRAAFEPAPAPPGTERGMADLQRRADRLLLGRFSPPGVVVNDALEIVQFRGETREFLSSPAGTPSFNVLKMAREGLLLAVKETIDRAKKIRAPARKNGLRVKSERGYRIVDLEVSPIGDPGNHFLVVFEDRDRTPKARPGAGARGGKKEREVTISRLEQELSATKEYLQSIIEEQEATNEELTSASEEVLSANEELQSTNEELETAKEELQSTNEELTTVNDELRTRNMELSAAHSDLTNVFASVNIPMILIDSKLTIRRFTPLTERVLNVISSDIGRPIRDIKPNVDVPDLSEIVAEVIQSVEGRELEVQDRQGQWYLMRVRPYRTVENRIDGAVIAFLDIDPVKLGLEQVNRARDYAEALVEIVGESLLVVDSSLRVRTANQPFYRTFDTSPLRIEGKRLEELPGWSDPALRAMLEPVVQRKATITDVEWQPPSAPGDPRRTLLLNARQIRLPSEPQPLVLLAIQDITERKRAETKLRDSETRYRRLFETAREAILLIDAGTGRVIDANPFFGELVGYPADTVIGQDITSLAAFGHEKAPEGAWDFQGGERIPPEMEIPLVTSAGREIWVNRVCSAYDVGTHRMVQCNLRDVTAAKLLRRELLQAQKLESMGSLAGGIAHDFNNILGILSGYISALKRGAGGEKKDGDAIQAMQTAVDRGAALIRQLLAFARRSDSEAPAPVDVNRLVGEVLKMIRETFPKNIAFEPELAAHLPPVEADANQFHQALLNLCVNARDAMPSGGRLTIRTRTRPLGDVSARFPEADADSYVSVAVADTGDGFDPATRERIFEPFFTTKKDKGGSGLGLAVAYGIVTNHHGFIGVESQPGKGTSFEILFPALPPGGRKPRRSARRKDVAPEPAAVPKDAAPRDAASADGETILVVEDERLLRASLKDLLESEGYRVLTARDGLDALAAYRAAPTVGVVLSDLQMPRLGGWEMFLKLRELDPAARVILMSGFFEKDGRAEMTAAGVRAFVGKPFRAREVLEAIRRVLDGPATAPARTADSLARKAQVRSPG